MYDAETLASGESAGKPSEYDVAGVPWQSDYTLCVDNKRLVSEFPMPLIVRMLRNASSNDSRVSVPNSATISQRPLVV